MLTPVPTNENSPIFVSFKIVVELLIIEPLPSLTPLSMLQEISTIDGKAKFLERHGDFKKFGINKGIEALAIDKHNRLIGIPEKPLIGKSLLPIYRYEKDSWSLIKEIKINNITGEFKINGPNSRLISNKIDNKGKVSEIIRTVNTQNRVSIQNLEKNTSTKWYTLNNDNQQQFEIEGPAKIRAFSRMQFDQNLYKYLNL